MTLISPLEVLVILFVLLIFMALPLIALINILKNQFHGNDKLIWVIVVLLLPIIGAILYFIIGTKQKIK